MPLFWLASFVGITRCPLIACDLFPLLSPIPLHAVESCGCSPHLHSLCTSLLHSPSALPPCPLPNLYPYIALTCTLLPLSHTSKTPRHIRMKRSFEALSIRAVMVQHKKMHVGGRSRNFIEVQDQLEQVKEAYQAMPASK